MISELTCEDRVLFYNASFPDFEELYLSKTGRIEGLWFMGNNYRTSGYYGAYPHGYLDRILSMFPDITTAADVSGDSNAILHVCSGSLPPGNYTRIDRRPEVTPDIVGDVQQLASLVPGGSSLALVDTPYSEEDARHYGTVLLSRRKTLQQCWEVLRPGGWVIWLDQTWPMFSKSRWTCSLAIGIIRSTNHRVRAAFGFVKK